MAPSRAASGTGQRIAVGVVVQNGAAVVGCRSHPPFAGYSEFPGGKVASGESAEAAVVREVQEESGLRVVVEALLARSDAETDSGEPLELLFFLCRPEGAAGAGRHDDAAAQPAVHPPFTWITFESLSTLRFPPGNTPVVDLLARGSFAIR